VAGAGIALVEIRAIHVALRIIPVDQLGGLVTSEMAEAT
jgi:hypothetical protein